MNNRFHPLRKCRKLSEEKQRAVRLRAEGTKQEAIACELNLGIQTIREWTSVPGGTLLEEIAEFKSYIADLQSKDVENIQAIIARDAVKAWERLREVAMVDGISKHITLAAVDSMLDRAGIARVTKTEGKHSINVTDEDRRKRFEEIKDLQSDIEPDQLLRLAGNIKNNEEM